jgi:hypothetical protein
LSTQNSLHHIGFGVVFQRMLTPKDLGIIIVKVTYIISLNCNVGFLVGTIALEVVYSMTMVALNIGGATSGCG